MLCLALQLEHKENAVSFIETLLPCQILGVCAYNLSRRLGVALATYLGVLTPALTFGLLLYLRKEQPNKLGALADWLGPILSALELLLGLAAHTICAGIIMFLINKLANNTESVRPR